MTNFRSHKRIEDRVVSESGSVTGSDRVEVDVVVVGTGAAGHSAAIMAARGGSSVMMLETAEQIGGTTWRSSGGMWIPNNKAQRELGITMERDATLKHMAVLAYPEHFDEDDPRLGLTPREYGLLERFFEMAPKVLDEYDAEGILASTLMGFRPGVATGFPPYYVSGYEASHGAVMGPQVDEYHLAAGSNPLVEGLRSLGASPQGDGSDLVAQLSRAATALGVEVRVSHRVDGLITSGDAVVGVTATRPDGQVEIRARQGVVFATGGFSHNPELVKQYLRPIVGSCSVPTAQGDFIPLALEVGAEIGNLHEAWWTELAVEMVADLHSQPNLITAIGGASSILVNFAGDRVCNEKTLYNERGKVHFQQAEDGSHPNRYLLWFYDQAVADDPQHAWPGRWPIPLPGHDAPYVIKGATLEELTANIADRLAARADLVEHRQLSPEFLDGLAATITRFNDFAVTGVDGDFGRGTGSNPMYEAPREGFPSNTMHPIAAQGPYYAIILGASTLDTKVGPITDRDGRVLRADETAIEGLYGAGNCVASCAGAGYWGGGSTLGPAITFGYLAGRHVAQQSRRATSDRSELVADVART
jgi:3-oxosteroid 1-dehydrogenase